MQKRSLTFHMSQALAQGALVALLVVGLVAGTAFAAKGGNGNGGSLALVMVEDANANGLPNYTETVTFDVSSTADKPYVNVRCYQGTAFVYDAWAGYYEGAWFGQTFTLSSNSWTSGAADCTARLVTWSRNGRERTLATMGFVVDA